jgi:hypothetical protein
VDFSVQAGELRSIIGPDLVEHTMKVVMKVVMHVSDRITVLHQGQMLRRGHAGRDPRQRASAADVPGNSPVPSARRERATRREAAGAPLVVDDVHAYYGEASTTLVDEPTEGLAPFRVHDLTSSSDSSRPE